MKPTALKALFCLCFCTVLTVTGICTTLKKPQEFSDNENRTLQTRPKFSLKAIFSGEWQSDYADYLSDQIINRDGWMKTQTNIQQMLGKDDIGGVYLGEENRYFEKMTDNDLSRLRFSTNLNAVLAVAESVPQIPVTVMLVPSAGIVQPEYLPKHAELYNAEYLYAMEESVLGETCTLADCKTLLKAHKAEYIYYRTDHHWTTYGAWFGYQALMQAHGAVAAPYESFQAEQVTDQFYGTLFSKVLDDDAVPDIIKICRNIPQCTVTVDGKPATVYDETKLDIKDRYQVFFGGNFGEVNIHTPSTSGKSLLMFKDSYANCLVPYLLNEYTDITMIDLRYQDGSWTERLAANPSEVLFLYELSNFASDPHVSTMITAVDEEA